MQSNQQVSVRYYQFNIKSMDEIEVEAPVENTEEAVVEEVVNTPVAE